MKLAGFRDKKDNGYVKLFEEVHVAKEHLSIAPLNPSGEDSAKSEQPIVGQVTRRSFLGQVGAATVAAKASPLLAAAGPAVAPHPTEVSEAKTEFRLVPLTLNINGQTHQLHVDSRTTLLDCLRENLNLPGTKKGCDHGQCGACTVHVNGQRVNSCLSFALMHANDQITTIEGLGTPDKLHPMQAAFVEFDAYQCGYCTSGQIMSAVALHDESCGPSDEDVKHSMYGNICRCGAYPNIVAAIQHGRKQVSSGNSVPPLGASHG